MPGSHESSLLNGSQWVSKWVSQWQAFPMIGLGSDKNLTKPSILLFSSFVLSTPSWNIYQIWQRHSVFFFMEKLFLFSSIPDLSNLSMHHHSDTERGPCPRALNEMNFSVICDTTKRSKCPCISHLILILILTYEYLLKGHPWVHCI